MTRRLLLEEAGEIPEANDVRFAAQLGLQAIQTWDRSRWERLAEVFAWTPPGQLGRALATASSDPAGAAVHLVLGVVWLPLLWWLHGVTTGKLVTAPVRPGTEGRRVRTGTVGVRAGVLALLPPGRATAVGARTVRTKIRTPREAVNTVVALLLGMGALVVAPMLGGSGRVVPVWSTVTAYVASPLRSTP